MKNKTDPRTREEMLAANDKPVEYIDVVLAEHEKLIGQIEVTLNGE